VYTVQDIEAGASLHFECSTAPTARLEGTLRATPGRVAVTGSLVDWKPGRVYEKKISSRIFLGELRSFPDMVSEPAEFSAHVPWEWDTVLLRLILKMSGTTYSSGGLFSLGTYETETWSVVVGDASIGTFPSGSSVIGW
jgi:hypothetical protein